MMTPLANAADANAHAALVARTEFPADRERYLLLTAAGQAHWVQDPAGATAFASMREATRAAVRLPSQARAYGVPRVAHVGRSAH